MELVEWVGGRGRDPSVFFTDNIPTISVVIRSSGETHHPYRYLDDGTHETMRLVNRSLSWFTRPKDAKNGTHYILVHTLSPL